MLKMCSLWLLWVACGVVVTLLARRRAARTEIVLIALVVIHFLLVEGLKLLEGCSLSEIVIYWRYHLPTLPLVLGVVALGIVEASRMMRGRLKAVVLVALMAVVVGESARKFVKFERRWGRELASLDAANIWAADLIRSDWHGPSRGPYRYYENGYWPNFRPKILDPGGFLAYHVGGSSPRASENGLNDLKMDEVPDYALLPVGFCDGFLQEYGKASAVKFAEAEFLGIRYCLYKRQLKDSD